MRTDIAPLAVTMGEPSGVGGEITLKAWQSLRNAGTPFFVLDNPQRLAMLSQRLGLNVPIADITQPESASVVFRNQLPVLPLSVAVDVHAGVPLVQNAKAVVESIERAVQFCMVGRASGTVTCPIQKSSLYEAGFKYPGHTEYLGALCGAEAEPIMMLATDDLRVVPVTIHVSLRQALEAITTELVVDRARRTARALVGDFGVAAPRLAVLGVNPHAGEGGAMGREDIELIAPAIAMLRSEGINAFGPLPPDTAFTARARKGYDAAICMYHDQALIPLKTLDVDGGVNVTLGLPIVRTSPDHGTALDIAGKGIAEPGSLIAAIRMAASIAVKRQETPT